jgi:hypothetical protein
VSWKDDHRIAFGLPVLDVMTTRFPNKTYGMLDQPGMAPYAAEALAIDPLTAQRLLLETFAFESLGYDYLVSPTLVRARHTNRRAWPNQIGAVTPSEALRLAGPKARMYRSVPQEHDSPLRISTNVGMIYDHAVIRFVPGLHAAIVGALGSADPLESAAVPYLQGIRARLGQFMKARD